MLRMLDMVKVRTHGIVDQYYCYNNNFLFCIIIMHYPFILLHSYRLPLSFQEYILETSDTERKATRLMEYSAAMTSGTDLAAAFSKGEAPSIKNSNSKTQLKSPSKFSQKSVIST